MHRVLKKDQILTIPNLLSVVRLLLIPLIIWLYCGKQNYGASVAVIVLSGLTDVADGIIARRFNMVSDFGKILDPVADKLTQAALIICLTSKYKWMLVLITEFAMKEIAMLVFGYVTIQKKDSVNSAQWHGKLSTVLLYAVMMVLILFPKIPMAAANVLILTCGLVMLMSFVLYERFYRKVLAEPNEVPAGKVDR